MQCNCHITIQHCHDLSDVDMLIMNVELGYKINFYFLMKECLPTKKSEFLSIDSVRQLKDKGKDKVIFELFVL